MPECEHDWVWETTKQLGPANGAQVSMPEGKKKHASEFFAVFGSL